MSHQIQAGEFHNLPNTLSVAWCVTVRFTFLTHGLGVIGTQKQLGYAMIKQFVAIRAELQFFAAHSALQPVVFNGEGIFGFHPVIFSAEDRDKIS